MLRKSGLSLLMLVVLAVGVILYGVHHSKSQKEEIFAASAQQVSEKQQAEKEKNASQAAEQMAAYWKERNQLSVLDFLDYQVLKNGAGSIAFYGDLAGSETWIADMEDYIPEQMNASVTAHRVEFPDADSYKMMTENKSIELKETAANVVFFLIPVHGDKVRDISLKDAKNYMESNYDAIKNVLPDALVVFVSPSPSSQEMENYNSRTLDYVSYWKEAVSLAETLSNPVFDLHETYLEEVETQNIRLAETLQADGKQLNAEGVEQFTTLFKNALEQPVNTSSIFN